MAAQMRGAVWLCLIAGSLACRWPSLTTADGQIMPDTMVVVYPQGASEGAESAKALKFYGKVAEFGSCPPARSKSIPHFVQLAQEDSFFGSFGLAGGSLEACHPLKSSGGHVLVAQRGTCNFLNKTLNAMHAGSPALLVGNVVPRVKETDAPQLLAMGCPSNLSTVCKNISIPTVMITQNDSETLQALLRQGPQIVEIFGRPHPWLDPSSLVVWAIAVCTVMYASYVGSWRERRLASGTLDTSKVDREESMELPVQDIEMAQAFGFIVGASAALVILFYFIRSLILFIMIMYCVASTTAISTVASVPLEILFPMTLRPVMVPCCGRVPLSGVISASAGAVMALTWFLNRHSPWAWLLQDTMSVSLCIHIMTLVRFPDVKVCTVLLSMALVYDVFWVFISPLLFSENVMIGVATGKGHTWNSTNPEPPTESIPMLIVVPKMLDWAGGGALLGLGDIVLPGLLVSFGMRVDYMKTGSAFCGYFTLLTIGYAIGLLFAMVASILMQMGQPALLYLVPCTLWSFLLMAWSRGELQEIWDGPQWASTLMPTHERGQRAVEGGDSSEMEAAGQEDDSSPRGSVSVGIDAISTGVRGGEREIRERLLQGDRNTAEPS